MSVPKSKRGESEMEFLHTARELQLYTIRRCVNFPKRYTFFIGQSIAQISGRIYEDVKRANSIYPTNKNEVHMRGEFMLKALTECHNLVAQAEVAAELFSIEAESMKYWMELVDRELNLIRGAMKRDKERYKNLPE